MFKLKRTLSSIVHRYIAISDIKTDQVHHWIVKYDTWDIFHWIGNLSEIMFLRSISATWRFWKSLILIYFDFVCVQSHNCHVIQFSKMTRHHLYLVNWMLNTEWKCYIWLQQEPRSVRPTCLVYSITTANATYQCLPRYPHISFSQSIYIYIMYIECDWNWWHHHRYRSSKSFFAIQLNVIWCFVDFHHDYSFP